MSSEPVHNPEAILNAAVEQFNAPTEQPVQTPQAPVVPSSETPPAPVEGEPTPDQMLALAQPEPSAPVEGSPFEQQLLNELGGDPKLIAQRIINLSNSNAQLTRQLSEVMSRMEGAVASPEAAEPDVAEAPQVKFYSEQISQIESDVQANVQQQSAIAAQAHEINAEVFRLQGELRRALDDTEKTTIQSQINNQGSRYAQLNAEYQSLARENKASSRELSKLRFEQMQAAEQIKAQILRSREQATVQAAEQAQYTQQVRGEFVNAVKQEAARFGISDVSQLVPLMATRFSTYAAQAPEGTPEINLAAFVRASMDQFAKSIGITPRQQYTQQAVQRIQQAPAPVQQPVLQQQQPQAFDSLPDSEKARLVREHAARVLGGGR